MTIKEFTAHYRPYLVVILLMAITSLALAFTINPNVVGVAGVRMAYPSKAGNWKGEEIRFCQNKACRKAFLVSQLKDPDVCPACGHELAAGTIAEKAMLPKDTGILKYQYQNTVTHKYVTSAIVLSSRERASIHRPEVCLRGQGNSFVGSHTITVPMNGRKPMKVKVLDMVTRTKAPDGKVLSEQYRYYAYWFVGNHRETASHYWRMFWMASDRIFHNRAHRWAYISISGTREPKGAKHYDEIRDFVQAVYPHLATQN